MRAILILSMFIGNWILIRALLRWLPRLGTRAKEKDALQRWSAQVKPAIGGIVFFVAVVIGWIGQEMPFFEPGTSDLCFLAGAILAFTTGLIDDIRRLSPWQKMTGQLAAAICLVATGEARWMTIDLFNAAAGVVLVVGLMNAVNMLDNMDGTSGIAVLGVIAWFMDGEYAMIAMAMAAGLLAFLVFNRYPSRIYMGDSGSLLLGFVAAFFLFTLARPVEAPVAGVYPTPVIGLLTLCAIPLVDALVVTINRLRHGRSPMQGGRDHTTHHLVYLGWNEGRITVLFIVLIAFQWWLFYLYVSGSPLAMHGALNLVYFFTFLCIQLVNAQRNLRNGKYTYSHG